MFKITACTVLELGSELISSDIIAFYELIKNGFDAGSKSGVQIDFNVVLRRNAFLALRDEAQGEMKKKEIVQKALDHLNHDAPEELLDKAQAILKQRSDRGEGFLEAVEEVYN